MDILFIIALVVTSIISVAFMVERGIALRWGKVIPPAVERAIQSYGGVRDLRHLQHVCEQAPSPIARLILFACEHLDWPKTETVDVVETRARHEVSKL